jgi:hypothetical protein
MHLDSSINILIADAPLRWFPTSSVHYQFKVRPCQFKARLLAQALALLLCTLEASKVRFHAQ